MKTVNLEEIKEKYGSIGKETCEGYQHEHILEAMREACNQAISEAYDIIQAARAGEIDNDFRSIAYRINKLKL